MVPRVAVTRQDEAAEELLTAVSNQEWHSEQGSDPILAIVGQWVDAGEYRPPPPPRQAISALAVEARVYISQWATLDRHDGLLY